MVPPAAGGETAATSGEDRSAPSLAEDDDLDDSEEDEETDELEDVEEEEDEDEEEQKPPPVLAGTARVNNGSSSSLSTSASDPAANNPSPGGDPAAGAGKANPSFNGGGAAAAAPVPAAAAAAEENGALEAPDRKRQRTEGGGELIVAEKKPAAVLEDSRRLFQRLFTDEDEIAILQGFLDFTSQRSAAAAHQTHHHDTGPFYEQIKTRLQLDFNKNQLVEKLRRLKKKYRNIMNKMSSGKEYAFKSAHDQATFELSRRIWGNSIYSRGGAGGPDDDDDDDPPSQPIGDDPHGSLLTSSDQRIRQRGRRKGHGGAPGEALLLAPEAPVEVKVAESHTPALMAAVPNVIEETMRSCLSPLFKELLYGAVGGSPTAQAIPLGAPPATAYSGDAAMDEKWRKQQILELEVYSKRIELVQEQIKLMLEELRK